VTEIICESLPRFGKPRFVQIKIMEFCKIGVETVLNFSRDHCSHRLLIHPWYLMIAKFLTFDVQTQLLLFRNETFEFPAVTVCNQMVAPLDYTQICSSPFMGAEKLVWFRIFLNNTDFRKRLVGVLNTHGYDLVGNVVRRHVYLTPILRLKRFLSLPKYRVRQKQGTLIL
jgi:hypothetical protein